MCQLQIAPIFNAARYLISPLFWTKRIWLTLCFLIGIWKAPIFWHPGICCLATSNKSTRKFHGEFMSPALFLFEVLKMVKLTRGPLVPYQLPKYWSRKPVIKNNFKILKKPHAYLQTTCKVSKDQLKTVVGVTGSRYLLPIRFCSIRTKKNV